MSTDYGLSENFSGGKDMKTRILIALMSIMLIPVFTSQAFAWLIYSKPEFRGRVIDAESKQPIEGAVVVVLYEKWEFAGPGGGNTLPMDAKETLTDNKGEFYFSSYKTMIGPLSRVSEVSFIIFKPGYMAVNRIDKINIPEEKYFSIKKDMIGKEGEIKYVNTRLYDPDTVIWKGLMGIVELRKGEKDPMIPTFYRSKELPILFRALNEDRRIRGYKGELK
jgi:hypothetical protein